MDMNMKLNKIYKKTIKVILVMAIAITSLITVRAASSAPSSLKITYSQYGKTPVSTAENFHIKYISGDSSKYVYCLTYSKKTPGGVSYTLGSAITDPGMSYILAKGANNSTKSQYFVTQSALWIYMQDKGLMTYSNSVNTLKNNVNKSSASEAVSIRNLVSEAKAQTSVDSTLTLSTDTTTLTFTLNSDKSSYISNVVKVTSNASYNVTVSGANATKEDVDGGFRIVVPASSVSSLSTSVSVSVSASKTVYTSYKYSPSNSKYQTMSYTIPDTLSKKVELSGTIKTTQVTISKVDATNSQELPGATLNLSCNDGAYTKEWVSTNQPVVLTDVPEGTCSLTETIAPEGYIKSSETITFNVVAGKVTETQVMKNSPLNTVTISKVDVTNGEELPGATLKLSCNDGAYVKEWVSTTEPNVLTDVPDGTCSLTETIAPEGYIKSEETITFTVESGKATATQVMKNAPEVKTFEVEISKLDVANSKELVGAKLEVTNESGVVVCEWTSDGSAHTCKNLIAGTYTLTEITAPDGYEKAESITFVIGKDGKLTQDGKDTDKIVMYDEQTPTIIPNVPDTLSLKSTISYVVGLAIILSGVGIVVKMIKKNEQ
jgi:hypothetical protein